MLRLHAFEYIKINGIELSACNAHMQMLNYDSLNICFVRLRDMRRLLLLLFFPPLGVCTIH